MTDVLTGTDTQTGSWTDRHRQTLVFEAEIGRDKDTLRKASLADIVLTSNRDPP